MKRQGEVALAVEDEKREAEEAIDVHQSVNVHLNWPLF